jgi:hypothetical protein
MAVTLKQILSTSPSEAALERMRPLTQFDSDLFYPLSLALLAQNVEEIDSLPAIKAIEDSLVSLLIEGRGLSQRTRLWNDWFLTFITGFRMFSGSTEATVVAPSGMLHRRNPKEMKTDCGKQMNEKWLLQFARGAEVDPTYQFGQKPCKTCFKPYSRPASAYARDIEASFADFPDLYAQADSVIRTYLRESLKKHGDNLRKIDFKQNTIEKALATQALYGYHSYITRNEIRNLVGADRYSDASLFFQRFIPRAESRLRRVLASELVKRLAQLPVETSREWFFRFGRNQEVVKIAEKAYGSLEAIPLPEGEELAELISSDSNISVAFEKSIIPTLLTGLWLDKVMPLVREAYPESKNLPKPILTAYRMLPNRKPRHTRGTRCFAREAFQKALAAKMEEEGLDVANLAAEQYLAPETIQAVLDGQEPDFTTFFTLYAFMHGYHHNYAVGVPHTA